MADGGDQARGLLVSGRFAELEDALCERVLEHKRGHPLAPLSIVVGSAAARTRIGDLLVRRLGATANVRITTMAALARDLTARSPGAPPVVLAGQARERLVRRLVAARGARGLEYFGPVCERPHFARALAATFADLREATIDPAAPWALAAIGAQTARSRGKASDLESLFVTYCGELHRRGLVDGAGLYLEAAAAALAEPAEGATIFYGVYDVNEAQEELLVALLRQGADLFVPVPRGGGGDGAAVLDAARALGMVGRPVAAPEASDDLARVAALWEAQQGPARDPLRLRGDGSLRVVSVTDERVESRESVRAVIAALDAGATAWDCAVLVPHTDDVERLAAALEGAGLPVACRRRDRSPGPRILARLLDCLAPPAGESFARRAVVDLLLTAPLSSSDAAPRETALWLDEARRAGVVAGLDQWVERVGRRASGLERRVKDLEARDEMPAGEDDDGAPQKLDALRVRLRAARSLVGAVCALSEACAALPARAAWAEWAAALGRLAEAVFSASEAASAADAAARVAALEVLGEQVDVVEVAAALRELLGDSRVQAGRVGREGVAVLTPLELRGLRFHSIVFTGLAEGGFPARGRPDPILGDAERQRLAGQSGVRLPLAESRDAEATLLFAFACEAARARLTLVAPRTDAATGRPRLPSRLLLRLASLAAGYPVGVDEFLSGAPLAPVWRTIGGAPKDDAGTGSVWVDERERDTASLLALSEDGQRTAARRYLATVLDDASATGRRLAMWRAARSPEPGLWDGLLGAEGRAALAGLETRRPFAAETHPTRLERYIDCPFAFLLRDVLSLEAPDEPGDGLEMDPAEYGTLAHEILQLTYEAVIERDLPCDGALAALDSAWTTACAAAESRGVTGAALAWEVRRRVLRDDLRETVRRDPVFRSGEGRPVAVEWCFGEAYGRPVVLELSGGRRIRFAGRLDRVDETPSGARVVDYKTGRGGTEHRRLRDGLGVQLPVYQRAVRQCGDQRYAEITCLYRFATRKGGFQDLSLAEDESAAGTRLERLVAEVVALVEEGVFARSTSGRCDFCDVAYACGVTAWARARKRQADSLHDLVRLQTSGPEEWGGDDA